MSTEEAGRCGAEWVGHALGLEGTEDGPANSQPAGLATAPCRFDALAGARSGTDPAPCAGSASLA
eukprot:797518-Alexandrium_andersonii.AAC.1